jgi:hypothetical protein
MLLERVNVGGLELFKNPAALLVQLKGVHWELYLYGYRMRICMMASRLTSTDTLKVHLPGVVQREAGLCPMLLAPVISHSLKDLVVTANQKSHTVMRNS